MFFFNKNNDINNDENQNINKAKNIDNDKIKELGDNLLQGDVGCLAVLYEELVVGDAKVNERVADYIKTYMRGLNANQLIHLNENFRQITSMEWVVDWKNVDLYDIETSIADKEAFLWVARLGTFHPNGFFREKCIRRLFKDKDSAAFFILRLNDWTKVLRDLAANVTNLINQMSFEEILGILPFLSRVENGGRRDIRVINNISECISARVREMISTYDLKKIKYFELSARRRIYKLFLENKLIERDEIKELIRNEKNSQLQVYLIAGYIQNHDISIEELDDFIEYKSEVVQRVAIEHKFSIGRDSWNGLEKKLLSKSADLRSSARYILQMKSDIDIRQFYLDRLDTQDRNICILGIGENGKENDADFLIGFLESDDAAVVKRTLHALGMLKKDKAEEIFWKYLQDKRLSVMGQAYREIIANDIHYNAKDIYELFMATESVELQRKLAVMLAKGKYWDRLPYVILLYSHEDDKIRNIIQAGVCGVNMYGNVSRDKADWIRNILGEDSCKVPERIKKSILFSLKFVSKGSF